MLSFGEFDLTASVAAVSQAAGGDAADEEGVHVPRGTGGRVPGQRAHCREGERALLSPEDSGSGLPGSCNGCPRYAVAAEIVSLSACRVTESQFVEIGGVCVRVRCYHPMRV